MLILTRKIDEAVIIDHKITVVVMDVLSRDTVRLGIDAPANIEIWREELENEREA